MKKNILLSLAGLFVVLILSTQAFSLILYDEFAGADIDQAKWTLWERVREIRDGKLIFEQRNPSPIEIESYPFVDNFNLYFRFPNTVNSIQADVTIMENAITNDGYTRARIYGRWYNDGTAGAGLTGDIQAEISLRNGPEGLTGNWYVIRYKNSSGTDQETLKSGHFTTSISVGTTYTLFVAYNSALNRFVFRLGSEEKIVGPTDLPARAGFPGDPFKALSTRVEVSDETSSAFVSATFVNVEKNLTPYDDFSSPVIDETKWTENFEWVREVTEGKFRSKVRSSSGSTSAINNRLRISDPSSMNAIQAKVTPVAYDNQEGANIVARIAGDYFNDGTPGGGYLGDVGAQVFIGGFNGEASPAAGWAVWTYSDFEGNNPVLIQQENFSKPVSLGNTYALLIGWDGSQFIFKIDDEEAVYAPTTAINPPNNPWKELATRILDPSGKEASMEALFDDVMVGDEIEDGDIWLTYPALDSIYDSCTLIATHQPTFQWTTTGTFSKYSLLYSIYSTDFSKPVGKGSIPGTGNSWTTPSGTWKKVLTSSYNSGSIQDIYWRVVGTKSDKTTVQSEVSRFQIGTAQAVTINSPLDQAVLSAGTLPAFDFNSECNVKFTLEFSTVSGFGDPSKIKGFKFTAKDPNIETSLQKPLTASQWTGVKKLVGTGTGYFRIKAWDILKREAVSEERSFTIQ